MRPEARNSLTPAMSPPGASAAWRRSWRASTSEVRLRAAESAPFRAPSCCSVMPMPWPASPASSARRLSTAPSASRTCWRASATRLVSQSIAERVAWVFATSWSTMYWSAMVLTTDAAVSGSGARKPISMTRVPSIGVRVRRRRSSSTTSWRVLRAEPAGSEEAERRSQARREPGRSVGLNSGRSWSFSSEITRSSRLVERSTCTSFCRVSLLNTGSARMSSRSTTLAFWVPNITLAVARYWSGIRDTPSAASATSSVMVPRTIQRPLQSLARRSRSDRSVVVVGPGRTAAGGLLGEAVVELHRRASRAGRRPARISAVSSGRRQRRKAA